MNFVIFFIFFIAWILFSTSDARAVEKKKNRSGGFSGKKNQSPPSLKEVSNLKAVQKIGKVLVSWDLKMPSEQISYIEIYCKYRKDQNFWRYDGFPRSVRAVELELLPLAPIEIKVQLVYTDGGRSEGSIIKSQALHKNVVQEFVDGREIHVYLPQGYNRPGERNRLYPVIYMHDGQNLFCEQLSYVEHWQIDTVMDRLIQEGKVEECLVVGIFNSSRRAEEYTPFADPSFGGGEARDFSAFIVERILPFIEKKYRVSRCREDRAVMGSSFGGILSLWMGYTYPEIFSMVGAVSPSLWIADGAMLEEIERQPKKNIKIWMDQGTREWSEFTRNAVNLLVDKGYEYGKDLIYYEVKDADHNEVAWSQRVECPFIFFKGKQALQCEDIKIDVHILSPYFFSPVEVVVNPIARFDNGIWYSLFTSAEYFIDEEITPCCPASVDATGVVRFNGGKEVNVGVRFGNITKKIKVENPDAGTGMEILENFFAK